MKGNKYGTHRVIEPKGVLPQPAIRIDNNMDTIYDNEILCDVITLNVDSASFTQIKDQAENDPKKVEEIMLDIVSKFGKHKNPVTGSGGMFIGTVKKIGKDLEGKINLKVGDKIASLVSLSLTPLKINKIKKIHMDKEQVDVDAQAILFESAIYAKLPEDLDEKLALAVLDVAGAPAQTAKLVRPGNTVLVIGASGKSGLLCCYVAKKYAGCTGKVIALLHSDRRKKLVEESGFVDDIIIADASDAVDVLEKVEKVTDGNLCDVVINCVSRENTEMGSILPCKDDGTVYFFSMATSFTKAALGAEGVGKDVNMIIGNGYTKNHAEITLDLMRESPWLKNIYEKKYVG
jgi:L-erythro-3,5-diaminohexanoate dehydrogenase